MRFTSGSRKCVEFQNDYDSITRGRRQVRDGFETPVMTATILRGNLSHTIFEHVQIFATVLCQFATYMYARKLRITATLSILFCDPLADACRQLSQNSLSPVR